MVNKRGLLIFFVLIISMQLVSSLGIVPAKVELDYRPGYENTFNYRFSGASDITKDVEVFLEGELSEYMEANEHILNPRRENSFEVTLKLPEEGLKPGKNIGYVGVRERIDEELVGGNVGTAVNIRSVFIVNVEYPGKYLELSFKSHNVNEGEPINFELGVVNKGDKDVVMNPRIEIYTNEGELIETLTLREREIKSQERIDLQKPLDTTGYTPGKYYAIAKVEYDNGNMISEVESEFRIGELIVNILNYTERIKINGLQKFELEVESGWNNKIEGVYASVSISNETQFMDEFKTSPTDLSPWQSKDIYGYLDTSIFSKGMYEADVTVTYYGDDEIKRLHTILPVEFYIEETNFMLIAIILAISIFILILLIIVLIIKNGKKK